RCGRVISSPPRLAGTRGRMGCRLFTHHCSMAKPKNTSGKNNADATAPAGRVDHLASYFLSLSLENVRCFGPKQTLDLSDGNGKPARWTIILGLNGTGKTTLLQSLVGFEVIRRADVLGPADWPRFYVIPSGVEAFTRHGKAPA